MQVTEELKQALHDAVIKAAEELGPDVVIKALCPSSLRAQADARPVAGVHAPCKGLNCGCTDGVSHSAECQAEHAAAAAGGYFIKSTHPEVSAPGLSERMREWIEEAVDYVNSATMSPSLEREGRALLTRASAATAGAETGLNSTQSQAGQGSTLVPNSAATVGEAKMPDTSDDPVNLLHRVLTIAGFSSEDAEYQKLTDALAGASQQQAEPKPEDWSTPEGGYPSNLQHQTEPGADERAAFEKWCKSNGAAALTHVFSLARHPNLPRYLEGTTEICWLAWQARAAQSGQRAGVAEGWQLVPVDPTDDMQNAYQEEQCMWNNIMHVDDAAVVALWKAMLALAAAPTQQQEG